MTWKEADPMREREEFVRMYLKRRYRMKALCAIFAISRKTGYKTMARFKEKGWEGLNEHSRAAHLHPNATDPAIAAQIIEAKHSHPSWGPE